MNAKKNYTVKPHKKLPSGSRKSAIITLRSIELPTFMFCKHPYYKPCRSGNCNRTKQNKKLFPLLSAILFLKTAVFLYGGSSRTKGGCITLQDSFVKANEDSIVAAIDETIKLSNTKADSKLFFVKNIAVIAINKGNLPLHGERLLVIMAIFRSLGLSMILAPVTPTALQPYPIQVVEPVFRMHRRILKHGSRLNAILGKTPKSSKIAKEERKLP